MKTLSPIVLSAAAELSEHIDASSRMVVSTPVWTNIQAGDPRGKKSPLYPLTVGYQERPRQPLLPVAGPSHLSKGKGKEKALSEDGEERGRATERGKCLATCASTSCGPPAKHRRASSKAIVTSDDDRELDAAPDVPQPSVDMEPMPPQVSQVTVQP